MYDQPVAKLPHSHLGVASFTVGLTIIVLFCLTLTLSISLGIDEYKETPEMAISKSASGFSIVLCSGIPLNLGGILLGGLAFLQRHRNRLFPLLGCVLNGLTLATLGLLYFLS
jgi:uncharacterized membrane protein YedE/YeeE